MNMNKTILLLYMENYLTRDTIIAALLFCLLGSLIHLLAHEMGHLVGGLLSGYSLLFLQCEFLRIERDKNGRLHLKCKRERGGQCVMVPKSMERVHFIAYNVGGICANILIVALCFVLFLCSDSVYMNLLLMEVAIIGIGKILFNLIPYRTDSSMSDGYVIKLLRRDRAIQKDYAMYLNLYSSLFLGEIIDPEKYTYEREQSLNEEELVYYNEIQDIVKTLDL